MNFDEIIKTRYSCRKFSDKKIEQAEIDKILEAANVAPTAVNYQPQKIFVLKSDEALAKVSECTRYGFNAPLNFMICYDENISWHRGSDGKDHGDVDASIVATHMMLKAWELGIGTTWVCSFNNDKARELFDLPDNLKIMGFLPSGYPSDDAEPAPMHFKRKEIEETVKYL